MTDSLSRLTRDYPSTFFLVYIFKYMCHHAMYLPIIELAIWRVCMYVSHVLDRKLLERLMSPSPKSQVMFVPAFS